MATVNTIPGKVNLKFSNEKSLGEIIDFKPGISSVIDLQPLDLGINLFFKRSFDIFFSLLIVLALLSWLIPVLAVLIKLNSKGPVFFLQKRNKKNGKIFTCIKFRTMFLNEEADLKQAAGNDRRITNIGKFLRKNHIDEFPQFINVLLGDMSVIGPRPHMISDNLRYEKLIHDYSFRSKVNPGITGLAQIMGNIGPVIEIEKMRSRLFYDITYIKHWSFALDVKIIFLTIVANFQIQKMFLLEQDINPNDNENISIQNDSIHVHLISRKKIYRKKQFFL